LVLGRIIEPTSKLDTVRVLGELGVDSPTRVTFMRCLKRVLARDYRATVAKACYRHATRRGGLALVLYDVTTLYFETPREDGLRKVGMSKERRVDPQITLGLLTTGGGFPLAVHMFEGNRAETKTLISVLTQFREQHPDTADIVVVADAGMLSAANLLALQQAKFSFIVGSKVSKAPYDLAEHLHAGGDGEQALRFPRAQNVHGGGEQGADVLHGVVAARLHHPVPGASRRRAGSVQPPGRTAGRARGGRTAAGLRGRGRGRTRSSSPPGCSARRCQGHAELALSSSSTPADIRLERLSVVI
jgi:hypothetical protein